MGIRHQDLREFVIRPVLDELETILGIGSKEQAEELLVFTAATESMGGKYLHQHKGPACGIYQMEPRTIVDTVDRAFVRWGSVWKYNTILHHIFALYNVQSEDADVTLLAQEVCGNMLVATALARLYYYYVKSALPAADSPGGMAGYWKLHWNTPLGRGVPTLAVEKYHLYLRWP